MLREKICIECQELFVPSSKHKKCPKCRYRSQDRICSECGNKCSKNAWRCLSCSQVGNTKNLKGQFTYYLRKAKDRRHSTDLEEDYLVDLWNRQDGNCAISGIPLRLRNLTGRSTLDAASLDRIDSGKGYVKGNVQFIAYGLNLAKNSFSNDEFTEFLLLITDSMRDERNTGSQTQSTDAASMPPAPPNSYGAVRESTALV